MSIESAWHQWEEGTRRLAAAPAEHQRALELVTGRIVEELRRRLGGAFTVEELAGLYDAGTDWCLDLAIAAAPEDPSAWDSHVVADAAFARYVREAADFAGGRRIQAGP
ncbi:MAG: hypothetical protein U0R70_00625 [Solirubrobacteraceae bacterium]